MLTLCATTRISGNGEISMSNKRFRETVKDSGELFPKYGKAAKQWAAKKELKYLFNKLQKDEL